MATRPPGNMSDAPHSRQEGQEPGGAWRAQLCTDPFLSLTWAAERPRVGQRPWQVRREPGTDPHQTGPGGGAPGTAAEAWAGQPRAPAGALHSPPFCAAHGVERRTEKYREGPFPTRQLAHRELQMEQKWDSEDSPLETTQRCGRRFPARWGWRAGSPAVSSWRGSRVGCPAGLRTQRGTQKLRGWGGC